MKKFLALTASVIVMTASMTACTPAPTYSGSVSITDLDHVKFRPKIGKMPMQTEKWKVTVCPTDSVPEVACWTERVKEETFTNLQIGDRLTAENGNITFP